MNVKMDILKIQLVIVKNAIINVINVQIAVKIALFVNQIEYFQIAIARVICRKIRLQESVKKNK